MHYIMINEKLVLIIPLVLLAATSIGINQVKAWGGSWGGGDNGPGPWLGQPICGAFCAGEQDAEYDHINNLAYQPYGDCLPCHSQGYWSNFHEGAINGIVTNNRIAIKAPQSISTVITTTLTRSSIVVNNNLHYNNWHIPSVDG